MEILVYNIRKEFHTGYIGGKRSRENDRNVCLESVCESMAEQEQIEMVIYHKIIKGSCGVPLLPSSCADIVHKRRISKKCTNLIKKAIYVLAIQSSHIVLLIVFTHRE